MSTKKELTLPWQVMTLGPVLLIIFTYIFYFGVITFLHTFTLRSSSWAEALFLQVLSLYVSLYIAILSLSLLLEVFRRVHEMLTGLVEEEEDGCPICLEDLNGSYDPYVRLRYCNHKFHRNCIDMWLWQSLVCPICRGLVISYV